MADRDPFIRSVLSPLAVLLIVFAVALTTGTSLQPSPTEFPPVSDAGSPSGGGTAISPDAGGSFAMRWQEVDRLVEDDRMAAAYEIVEEILAAAIETGDEEQWTRALIRSVQLRTALHGYETAVRLLQEQPLPQTPRHRSVVELFYAQGLITYLRAYSWEIAQREPVESSAEVDLKAWSADQIFTAAQQALERVWQQREVWGDQGLGVLAEYLDQNTYPARIRGTLRDTVTYLWVSLLADTSLWRPVHQSGLHRLDLEFLLTGADQKAQTVALADPDVHPVIKIAALLADLEAWHTAGERPEAALEARLERLRRLHSALEQRADRVAIRADLETRIEALGRQFRWWSEGQAVLAGMVREEPDPEALMRAREIALVGERAHPDSVGGRHCRHIIAAIEAPSYDITSMQSDGLARRSVLVRHQNMEALHFRAYRVDLLAHVASSADYDLLPGYLEVPEFMHQRQPEVEWSVELPPTPDYRMHQTWVTPQLERPGFYVLVASARKDFGETGNRLAAVDLVIGDLVLITRNTAAGFDVVVRSGDSGQTEPGVEVMLYRYDHRRGHRLVASLRTDDEGRAQFTGRGRDHERYFLLARRGDEVAVDGQALWRLHVEEPAERTAALIYTDRSVYRPEQRIRFKIVAYRGGGEEARFQTLAARRLTVELLDANHEIVEARQVRTNSFGSVSGEFEIPGGRLLGRWRLRTNLGGETQVSVEEYKRPTFEVTLLESEKALRLNRPSELAGEVRYYFGLPVVDGEVAWQVERVPVFPRWWYWGRYRPDTSSEIIAAGKARTDADGRFQLTFVPAADERDADSPGVSYDYRLSAEVTDEGGETRSAQRTFRLGFVSVQATVEADQQFYLAGETVRFVLRRSDLDGTPRPGTAKWQLQRLRQPAETLLPADQPLPESVGHESRFETAGDLLRPRWDPGYWPEQILGQWPADETLDAGEVQHGEDGTVDLELAALPPGAYRLAYSTVDDFGSDYETSDEFVVARNGGAAVALPALFLVESSSVSVGRSLRVLMQSGLPRQEMVLELFRQGRRFERQILSSDSGSRVLEIPVGDDLRGGFSLRLTALRDHQLMTFSRSVFVPWEDRQLQVRFGSFRDLLKPRDHERWSLEITGADPQALVAGSVEVLAYMYDRSLDLFAPHNPPQVLSLYPQGIGVGPLQVSLGIQHPVWSLDEGFQSIPGYRHLRGDRLRFFDGYGIGGPGRRFGAVKAMSAVAEAAPMAEQVVVADAEEAGRSDLLSSPAEKKLDHDGAAAAESLRSDFSETAFWQPHLLLNAEGTVTFEFTVPDSVTEWNVWAHAVSRDLKGGSVHQMARSVKELMVRPYLPRFLREGDRAQLRVVVNNASEAALTGELAFDIQDPDSGESLLAEFGLSRQQTTSIPFQVEEQGSTSLTFPVVTPTRVGEIAVEVTARAGEWSDGERRPLPLLPGRMHLSQSRFAALRDADRRELHFADLAAGGDPTRIDEQLVVSLDAQLFYGVLQALPYLVSYPYECTEQTLNRFLSTGIVASLYAAYPAVARMAKEFSERETRFETWDSADPNRKMTLEETPWLQTAQGGETPGEDLINVLVPEVARAERRSALAKLQKAQTSLGGFPWWPGGPPSPYMTLYLLHGFSRALEFDIEIPQPMVVGAWGYLHRHYIDELVQRMIGDDCCWETITLLNYVLSSYADSSWTGEVFSEQERADMLQFSFRHWRRHSPLLKSYLALTLERAGRQEDADLVFASVMDSAQTTRDEGTFWAPEDRAWLWYNDTIETHAFALRTLMEIEPQDERRHGLVQWLFLNKQLNHWRSTRATAEVIYSLVHYLQQEGGLGQREAATVEIGERTETFTFEPDTYTGGGNRMVIPGEEIDPQTDATVVVEKTTPGLLFASATWHFSTAELPAEARGDLFGVERRYFRRLSSRDGWVLQPLEEGAALRLGDQVEVHLSLRARHAAEYVHLRDPRAAGFEPVTTASGYQWNLGIGWYEEVRDSGTNFFFERLPVGEYTFKYRLRVAVAGQFKVAPAVLQSMYAPEFTAYSAGAVLDMESD